MLSQFRTGGTPCMVWTHGVLLRFLGVGEKSKVLGGVFRSFTSWYPVTIHASLRYSACVKASTFR
jgi:hypothetical protein